MNNQTPNPTLTKAWKKAMTDEVVASSTSKTKAIEAAACKAQRLGLEEIAWQWNLQGTRCYATFYPNFPKGKKI
jgi:hypothetical protein